MKKIDVIVAFKKVTPYSTLVSKAIGWYTKSDYYHVEIAVDKYWVSVFPEKGVELVEIEPLKGDWEYKKIENVTLTEEQYNKIVDFLLAQENKEYDFKGIFLSQFIKLRIESKNKWFSSELVSKLLQLMLVEGFISIDPATQSPENVFKILKDL